MIDSWPRGMAALHGNMTGLQNKLDINPINSSKTRFDRTKTVSKTPFPGSNFLTVVCISGQKRKRPAL